MLAGGVEMVFEAADPPHRSTIALWHRSRPEPGWADPVELVLPAASGVRRRRLTARRLTLAEALPALVALPVNADVGLTAAAWAVAAKAAVNLVARGRLLPAATPSGMGQWRAGPLDPDDQRLLSDLAAALPPEAHAIPIPGTHPLRIPTAQTALTGFIDAVADTLVRTPAAEVDGPAPFAAVGASPLTDTAVDWLATVGAATDDDAQPGLRLELAGGADGAFSAAVQLRSRVDPSLTVDAADLWDAPAVVLSRMGADAETDLLLALRRASRAWAPIGRLLDQARPEVLELDDHEATDLLGPAAEALAGAGLEVLWPTELTTDTITLRGVVTTASPASVTESVLGFEGLTRFAWEAALGDQVLTAAELDQLADAKRPLVRIRGRWVLADPTFADRLRRRPPALHPVEALAAALAGTAVIGEERVEVRSDGPLADLVARLTTVDGPRDPVEPDGLRAELRPYQRRGLAWLAEMSELGLGGCLADDMGLGKTVQVIALHLHRHQSNGGEGAPTLVICPASVLGNWEREIERFAPAIPIRRFHGGDRHLSDIAADEIVLATYGVVRRDQSALAEVRWDLVVADETQHAKNPLSRIARGLRAIPARARIALTGTPVENRLSDLWAILDWTTPGLLGPLDRFRRQVAVPVERHHDPEATESLARVIRPFLLRRRKSDPEIAPDLPPKTTTDEVVPLTAEQVTLYEAVVREGMAEVAEADGMARRGLVLRMLTALKQVCNHPAQYLRQTGPLPGRSGKLDALDDLLATIIDSGESTLVFSQYVAMARIVERHLAARHVPTRFLHGGVEARRRDRMVAEFQDGAVPVFLLSLKAGGTGLNLTQATHVVHFDRWWNPAVEDQASDRAWRIGQDRPVQVHRLITEGTVEDHIGRLLESKRALADSVVGGGEAWLTELDDDALAELVTLGAGS